MARAQNLHFGALFCGSQDFKALILLVFAGRPAFAFVHYGPVEMRVSGVFKKKREPNFLTRDTLFDMKLTLSSAASSMLHELNFK